jgi:dihydrofolate synthase/folylpolyglutamate synthase
MLPAGTPLSDWLTWLETLSPKEIDLGLERVHAVLGRLSLDLPSHVLLIAGTNGKGSSVAMTTALLQAADYRVGAYTSPHVSDFNERIVVNGEGATDAVIVNAFGRIERARESLSLTYFEFGTLAAMLIFADADLDVWVLEVGLGGRLDATNAIEPTASLITNVSLDHCDWLGDDVEAIGAEKAGVIRPGVPTVFGAAEVPRSVTHHANRCGAELLLAGRDFQYSCEKTGTWNWTGRDVTLDCLRPPGLSGEFQVRNASAVLALVEAAGLARVLDVALVNQVLPKVALAGRMQSLRAGGARWLLDVAHNPAAAEKLAELFANDAAHAKVWAIIGLLDDKDIARMVMPLNAHVDHWIAVTADSHRAVQAPELARRISDCCNRPCRVSESLAAAMRYAQLHAGTDETILVTGSFYTVGPALRELELYSPPEP